MIDILKRIFIGVAIGMSIFFLKGLVKVHALSFDFEQGSPISLFNQQIHIQKETTTCSGNPYLSSQSISFDSPYNNTDYDFLMFNYAESSYYYRSSGGNSGDVSYSSFFFILYEGGANNCFTESGILLCPILKGKKYTGLSYHAPCSSILGASYFYNIVLTKYATPLINTNKNANDTITDDSDSSGSGNSYDSSGVDSNSNKEDTLTQDTEDLISDFDIDLSNNSHSFEYIFYLLDKFVKANAKVFGVILSLLGFGFVKLVIGR